ncbi:MAG: hypothetical protein COB04_15755 [Gammaproteobacteria bacterium]|nr:MAG: hypothetical protein COB04_15755 [Gammaproteobacteria bacterium]
MKTIHKYEVPLSAEGVDIELPRENTVRKVEYVVSVRRIFIWVEVEANAVLCEDKCQHHFRAFSTGDGIPEEAIHVGSVVDQYLPEAYHVYVMPLA